MKKTFLIIPLFSIAALLIAACGGSPATSVRSTVVPSIAAVSANATDVPTQAATSATVVPAQAGATGLDTDGDGIPDSAESLLMTDPNNPDTDGDGQNDRVDTTPIYTDSLIQETSTTVGFTINSILVENNVDANNQAVSDHLELSVTNTSSATLTGFDIYYTINDPTAGTTEGYYRTLPDFALNVGETKSVHIDNTGMADHFSGNPYSVFYTNVNQLVIDVTLHAAGYAPQTTTVNKDPGGEGGVE